MYVGVWVQVYVLCMIYVCGWMSALCMYGCLMYVGGLGVRVYVFLYDYVCGARGRVVEMPAHLCLCTCARLQHDLQRPLYTRWIDRQSAKKQKSQGLRTCMVYLLYMYAFILSVCSGC